MNQDKKYTDIHTHLLYGVDDGVKTQDQYRQMLKSYQDAGIGTVVFTPHRENPYVKTDQGLIQATYEVAAKIAGEYGITTTLGCEFYYDGQKVIDVKDIDGRFALVEFPTMRRPQHLTYLMESIADRGLEPIIAHVERYKWLKPKSDEIKLFQSYGAWIQVNVEGIEDKSAKPYLKKDLVDIIASDNHGDPLKAAKLRKYLDEYSEISNKMNYLEIGDIGDNR